MPLNPAYSSQSSRTLPFCLGYVKATGDKVKSIIGVDGSTVEQYILGDGEWDGPEIFTALETDHFVAGTLVGGVTGNPGATKFQKFFPNPLTNPLDFMHFHGGSYSPIGLPNNLISLGPDQGSENWLQYFPAITPAQFFSNLAYYVVRRIITTTPLTPIGIWRTTRCRIFDSNGNVINYCFTTNPAWQMVETLLRYQIKPQQAPLMGLTNAERACFDWGSVTDLAASRAELLANGKPRFAGNFAFAADASLASMMETQLRNCRAYKRERGGQIGLIGDDPRVSVFTFSQRNIVPGSVKLNKKDLSQAPNVFVPQYRDLEIPAVSQVASVATTGSGPLYSTTWNTVSAQGFFSQDDFSYSGGTDDADFAGDYQVALYTQTVNNVTTQSPPPNATQFNASGGPQKSAAATGGYLGTQKSRFKQRDPRVVQHRSHQKMRGQIAPGIAALPKPVEVRYDMGNNTFDQTNRVMKFLRDSSLGADVQGWVGPIKGTVSGFLEAVDDSGKPLAAIEPRDIVTLDDTAAPDFPGVYEVLDPVVIKAPVAGGGAEIQLTLQTYNPAAATDISDAPGDSYQTLPNNSFPTGELPYAAYPYWLLQATPTGGLDGSGNLTITIADLSIQWAGVVAPTIYPAISLNNVPVGSHLILYLVVTTPTALPTLVLDAVSANPAAVLPFGYTVIYAGTIAASSGGAGTLAVGTGTGLSPVSVSPGTGYLGGAPIANAE